MSGIDQMTETGRKPLRKRRKEVFDAAARVFAARGYHGASTQDIADRLGMRQASLYYYFHSKEAALEAVCAQGAAGYVEAAEAIAATDQNAEKRIALLLEAHISPLTDRSDYTLTFLNERKWLPKESRRRVSQLASKIEEVFERVIREGVENGEFRPDLEPRLVTLGLLGMMNNVATWYVREGRPVSEISAALTSLVLQGALKRDI
nr:TetR family transcriptional regulator [uncultured bacterium]